MARTDADIKAEQQELFLHAYRESGLNASAAARAAGIDRSTYVKWRDTYIQFAAKIQAIRDEVIDRIDALAWKKAQEGDTQWMKDCLRNHRRTDWAPREEDHAPELRLIIEDHCVTKLDGNDAKVSPPSK